MAHGLPSDRLTYGHFVLTGKQDCGNAFDTDMFMEEWRKHPELGAQAIVDRVWKQLEDEDGIKEDWFEQHDDFEGLDPEKCYESWRSGWKGCAVRYVENDIKEAKQRAKDEEEAEAWYAARKRGNPGAARRPMRARNPHNPMAGRFVVVRVDRDDRDTYAAPHRGDVDAAIQQALDLANPDRGSIIEYGVVTARDAGAARLARPGRWTRLSTDRTRNPPAPELEDAILDGMALAIWVTSFADWAHEQPPAVRKRLREEGLMPYQGGGDWVNYVPELPPTATAAAQQLADLFYRANTVTMTGLLERAMAAEGKSRVSATYAETFGHYMVMQALRTGVSWFDDHPRFSVRFPEFEAHSSDGESVDWSPMSQRNPGRRPNALSSETYEVVREGDKTVIGHVTGTWLGDAHDKAVAKFGQGVVCFASSARKGVTPVGKPLWSGSSR